jgi:hypothetical protein
MAEGHRLPEGNESNSCLPAAYAPLRYASSRSVSVNT